MVTSYPDEITPQLKRVIGEQPQPTLKRVVGEVNTEPITTEKPPWYGRDILTPIRKFLTGLPEEEIRKRQEQPVPLGEVFTGEYWKTAGKNLLKSAWGFITHAPELLPFVKAGKEPDPAMLEALAARNVIAIQRLQKAQQAQVAPTTTGQGAEEIAKPALTPIRFVLGTLFSFWNDPHGTVRDKPLEVALLAAPYLHKGVQQIAGGELITKEDLAGAFKEAANDMPPFRDVSPTPEMVKQVNAKLQAVIAPKEPPTIPTPELTPEQQIADYYKQGKVETIPSQETPGGLGYTTAYGYPGQPRPGKAGGLRGLGIKLITPEEAKAIELRIIRKQEVKTGVATSTLGDAAKTAEKLIASISTLKPLQKEQRALISAERGQRFARAIETGKEIGGERGYYAELGQMGGPMARVSFEPIRPQFTQAEIDSLFNVAHADPFLSYGDTLTLRRGLSKIFAEEGARLPTEAETAIMAREYGPGFTKAVIGKWDTWQKVRYGIYQTANIPRSLMASFDLSAPLRQGLFLIGRKEFYTSFADMFKYWPSDKAYQAMLQEIASRPTYKYMRQYRLAMTDIDALLGGREERFMSSWAEKIPAIGAGVRASGRAYTGFLNKLRADTFDSLFRDAERAGLNPTKNPRLMSDIANFVNNATGRGSLWGYERAAVSLNSFFFSPRLMASRLNLLNPVYYIKLHPFVRQAALKSLISMAGAGVTMLQLSKFGLQLSKLAEAEVGANPFSADFGKLKIGNTRIDPWGGFQQYIRTGAQFIAGKRVSSTGRETRAGQGYRGWTRKDILIQAMQQKTSPVVSFAVSLTEGKDWAGKPLNVPKEIVDRFIPMVVQDAIDIYNDDPKVFPASALGIFGMGLQTYEAPMPKLKRVTR